MTSADHELESEESLETPELLDHDDELDSLIDAVAGRDDFGEGRIAMTLLVGGAVVRGDVCSKREWGRAHRGLPGNEESVAFQDSFAGTFEGLEPVEIPEGTRRRFVHMTNATIQSGGVAFHAPTWRGRLSEVSGWSFGR